MINGLDLFTGIGGISLALQPWVRTVCYVEIEPYCQQVIQTRIKAGDLEDAPIWDDIRTFDPTPWIGSVDIITGGFPCQDISTAGKGVGLGGERSGLFFEIMRLAEEIQPKFLFLENVQAIRTRGLDRVGIELANHGYDYRWDSLSAYDVGAPHQRRRWWCLGWDTKSNGSNKIREVQEGANTIARGIDSAMAHPDIRENNQIRKDSDENREAMGGCGEAAQREYGQADNNGTGGRGSTVAHPNGKRLKQVKPLVADQIQQENRSQKFEISRGREPSTKSASWWAVEPDVGRVADGVPSRVDRIKSLGNSVVPQCAREAFRRLMSSEERITKNETT